MTTLVMEWRHTYRSARRDGDARRSALRRFAGQVLAGWRLTLGLHPQYDSRGHAREMR